MPDLGLSELTASAALTALSSRQITSEALVSACLARIANRDQDVEAWTHLDPGDAIAQARASDQRRRAGGPLGPLEGIPVGIKDVIDTADYPTENGTPAFSGRRPAADAFVVSKLRSAGAIILGKTVTTELAFWGPGKTKNPRNSAYTPGGSSSGSAASVADFQVPLAIGTQTAGSLIRPASYCGTIGFKPTFGYLSRTGVLPQSPPLDTIGGYGRTCADIALLIDAMTGDDPSDGDQVKGLKPELSAALKQKRTKPPRLAFVKSPAWPNAEPAAQAVFESFANSFGAAAEVVETPLPADFEGALRLQQIIQFADIAKLYGPIADANAGLMSSRLMETIAAGRGFSKADYASALAEREGLYDQILPVISSYDVILTPSSTGPASRGLSSIGSPMFNALWTYLGMPCISLPLLTVDDMPFGVQLVAARGADAAILQTAAWLMEARGA